VAIAPCLLQIFGEYWYWILPGSACDGLVDWVEASTPGPWPASFTLGGPAHRNGL